MSFFSIALWQENEAGSHFGLTWSSQEMADLRWHINWWLLAWASHTCKCQWVCSSGGSGGIPEYSFEYLFHSNSSKRIGSVWEKQDVPLLLNFSPGHYSITIYYLKKNHSWGNMFSKYEALLKLQNTFLKITALALSLASSTSDAFAGKVDFVLGYVKRQKQANELGVKELARLFLQYQRRC